ncbi:sensor histidine kinase RcsC [mine drainage metagenome]|uniref:histidine kinase n=1 Tax=mine drainage metagenome TaxID=410659 RepID=A0A1J5R7P4_9ZZZZ
MDGKEDRAAASMRMDALARNLPLTVLSGLGLAPLILTGWFVGGARPGWLAVWCLLVAALAGGQTALLGLYRRRRRRPGYDPRFWERRFLLACLLWGGLWGLYGFGAAPFAGGIPTVLLLTALAALSMPGLGVFPPALLAFVLPTLGGPLLRLALNGDAARLSLAGLAPLFLALLSLALWRAGRAQQRSVRLAFSSRRLLAELRAGQEATRRLIEASPLPLLLVRVTERRVLFANSRARALLDEGREVFVDPLALAAIAGEAGRLGALWDQEMTLRGAAGRPFQALVSAAPLRGYGDAALLIGFYDVTQRKLLEEDLRRAKTEAEAASRAKSDFLAMISHEIRTPMNGVAAMAELLSKTALDMEQRGMVAVVRHSADHLLGIIDDILDFSKIEAGRMGLDNQPFALRRQVEEVADLVATRAGEKGVEVVVDIAPDLPARFHGDAGKLRQVLTNLLGNAAKFTERGHIRLAAEADAAGLVLRVDDTGPGIAADLQARLFQPFTQGDGTVARCFGGTGLGLSISRRLVQLMGGDIAVDSRPGAGTSFRVSLPLVALPAQSAPPPRLAGLRVAVSSATRPLRAAVENLLRAEGALPAADAAAADLVIQDGTGPATDRPCLRLVPFYRFEAQGAAGDVVRKPVHLEDLVRAIQHVRGEGAAPPAAPPGAHGAARAWRAPERAAAAAANTVILVVEDNGVNRLVISRMLDRLGMVYDVAVDGQFALERLRRGAYGLILTDFHMPRTDGLTLARTVRDEERDGQRPPVPIVALTADALPETAALCLQNGMQDFLTKPLTLDGLERILADWLPAALALRRPQD